MTTGTDPYSLDNILEGWETFGGEEEFMKIVKGDMIKSMINKELQAYGHQCNCFNRMGRGIAPLLAKANPEVREADNETVEGNPYKLGTFSRTYEESLPVVYNLYGQFHWVKFPVEGNRNTDYFALMGSLQAASLDMQRYGITTFGLPLIGCGLAGGDWEIVEGIIEDVFKDTGIEVTIFKL